MAHTWLLLGAMCAVALPPPSLSFTAPGAMSWGHAQNPSAVHRTHTRRVGNAGSPARSRTAPSLWRGSVSGQPVDEEGQVTLRGYKLWYKVTRPSDSLKDEPSRLPVVVLHGGPGVPSDYLYPFTDALASIPGGPRKCYLYDQLGCGLSDEPQDFGFYSPDQTAKDCADMLQHLADQHGLLDSGGFHLYGQSWGGCVAAETILSHYDTTPCLKDGLRSAVLSGTPSSPMLALETAGGLIDFYANDLKKLSPDEVGMPPDWPRTDEFFDQWILQESNVKFLKTHNLRMEEQPDALSNAYSKQGTVWRGAKTIAGYNITQQRLAKEWPQHIPALIMRGEHDFVTPDNKSPFIEGIPLSEYAEAKDLSHQAHLENTPMYVAIVDGYLRRVESGAVMGGKSAIPKNSPNPKKKDDKKEAESAKKGFGFGVKEGSKGKKQRGKKQDS